MTFYVKKTFVDPEPGIEMVNIHYTWPPSEKCPIGRRITRCG